MKAGRASARPPVPASMLPGRARPQWPDWRRSCPVVAHRSPVSRGFLPHLSACTLLAGRKARPHTEVCFPDVWLRTPPRRPPLLRPIRGDSCLFMTCLSLHNCPSSPGTQGPHPGWLCPPSWVRLKGEATWAGWMPVGLPHPPRHSLAALGRQEGETALWAGMLPGNPSRDSTSYERLACGHLESGPWLGGLAQPCPCHPPRSSSMAPEARCTTHNKWGPWARPSAPTCWWTAAAATSTC